MFAYLLYLVSSLAFYTQGAMAIIDGDKFNKLHTEPHYQFNVSSCERKPNHGKLEPIDSNIAFTSFSAVCMYCIYLENN